MPSSSVRTFTDPAEFGAAIRAGQIEVTTTGRGVFSGKIIRMDLHRLWMQRFSDNLPRVARIASSPARTTGTTSWKAPNPAGLASSASCGSISRTSAANAPR